MHRTVLISDEMKRAEAETGVEASKSARLTRGPLRRVEGSSKESDRVARCSLGSFFSRRVSNRP